MEALVSNWNYMDFEPNDSDKLNQFQGFLKQIKAQYDSKGIQEKEVRSVVTTFLNKICIQPFPGAYSNGYYYCAFTINYIKKIMQTCKTLDKNAQDNIMFDILIACLARGKGICHYRLISEQRECDLVDWDFIKRLRGPNLKRLIDAIKQDPLYIDETGDSLDDFCDALLQSLNRVIEEALRGEDDEDNPKYIEEEVNTLFLDLYHYLMIQVSKTQEDVSYTQGMFINTINNVYGTMYTSGNPYNSCQNADIIKQHLETVRRVITSKVFPRTNDEDGIFNNIAKLIFEGVTKDQEPEETDAEKLKTERKQEGRFFNLLYPALTDFTSELCGHPNAKKMSYLIKQYDSVIKVIARHHGLFENWAPKFGEMLEKIKDKNMKKRFEDQSAFYIMHEREEYMVLYNKKTRSEVDEEDEMDIVEPEQIVNALELSLYFVGQVTVNPKGMAVVLKECRDKLYRRLSGMNGYGVYEINDVALLQRHMQILKSILRIETFPRFELETTIMAESCKEILQGLTFNRAKELTGEGQPATAIKECENVIKDLWIDATELFEIASMHPKASDMTDLLDAYSGSVVNVIGTYPGGLFEKWAERFGKLLEKKVDKDAIGPYVEETVKNML